MNRRSFIEKSAAFGTATLLSLPGLSRSIKYKYKMGLQLYTIRDDMAKDPFATLKAAKTLGYQDFEHYGFDSTKGTFYGYKAPEFKSLLDDMDLTVTSGHYPFSDYFNASDDEMKRFVDACIEGAKTVGLHYITWPWLAPELRTIENFKRMTPKLNMIGEQVTAAGLGFAYHNHGFEFEDHNGENGYDIVLKETDPKLVKLQIDMYWVMHSSSYTPAQLIKKQPGRFVMWHIKDMDKVTRDYTELGNGSIDYTTLLPDPEESGLEFYYLEQGGNFATSPMQSITDSAAYFKKYLQKFL